MAQVKDARGNNAKNKNWIAKRHTTVRKISGATLGKIIIRKYNIDVERFSGSPDRPYLILFNHQTPSDQFFVGISFKQPVYFVASEDIFSNGWISNMLRLLVAPIPIKKNTGDARAVLTCMKVAAEGGTIAMAPEGNRTYSGRTGFINPSIIQLIRRLKLPVILYRIEGGYGCEPRWSSDVRKGTMRTYIHSLIEPEEYAAMSNHELYEKIKEGLYVDENVDSGIFRSNKRAEYIERALYVCPECGLTTFESKGNFFKCKKCGRSYEYGSDKRIRGVGNDSRFEFFGEWYDYQNAFVSGIDPSLYVDEPIFRDTADLYSVILYKKKVKKARKAQLSLYGDRVEIRGGGTELILPFSELSTVTVLGRNKLNLYYHKDTYQIKGAKSFNALKYVNFYYHYMNLINGKGDKNGEFLGL